MIGFPRRIGLVLIVLTAVATATCGEKPEKGGGSGPRYGLIEGAFNQAAAETGVPARFMMAAAYLESRLSPAYASATYRSITDTEPSAARGTVMTETAFGMTMETLGLDPANEQSSTLEVQMTAYSRYVAGRLKADGVTLSSDPRTDADKFRWIQNLALLHRDSLEGRMNAPIIFGQEMLQILNQGFVWQDPRNGETLTLAPENPPLDIERFPVEGQRWFTLMEDPLAEINLATFLPLMTASHGEFENKPRRIEVIHCPLSLSACLELQTRTQESDVHLAAHYVIPPIVPDPTDKTPRIFKTPIQLVRHKEAVIVTDEQGDNNPIEDAIVIMLVGNSGRIVEGKRKPAIPTWFTDFQLAYMTRVINEICTQIWEDDSSFDRAACMSPGGQNGVRFRHQDKGDEYRWGDIADFDETIFNAYLQASGGLNSATAFDFGGDNRRFVAGHVPLNLTFGPNASAVVLERLARCATGQLIWQTIANRPLNGETSMSFSEPMYDSGPNANGDQFLRASVYGSDGALLGWDIDQVHLSGFRPGESVAPAQACVR